MPTSTTFGNFSVPSYNAATSLSPASAGPTALARPLSSQYLVPPLPLLLPFAFIILIIAFGAARLRGSHCSRYFLLAVLPAFLPMTMAPQWSSSG